MPMSAAHNRSVKQGSKRCKAAEGTSYAWQLQDSASVGMSASQDRGNKARSCCMGAGTARQTAGQWPGVTSRTFSDCSTVAESLRITTFWGLSKSCRLVSFSRVAILFMVSGLHAIPACCT
jgi:hypothetical protein